MAKQTINVGSAANDGTGDTLRAAAIKINTNFTEVYENAQGAFDAANAGISVITSQLTSNTDFIAAVNELQNVTIQVAHTAANDAWTQANTGSGTATAAFLAANAAWLQANTATPAFLAANAAWLQANTATPAFIAANNAWTQANTGSGTATSAFLAANTGWQRANDAYGVAESAYIVGVQAPLAWAQANTGSGTATAAFLVANTADGKATSSFLAANVAQGTAQAAFDKANTLPSALANNGNTLLLNSSGKLIAPDDIITETAVFFDDGNGNLIGAVGGAGANSIGFNAYAGNNVTISTNDETHFWEFGADGKLTAPGEVYGRYFSLRGGNLSGTIGSLGYSGNDISLDGVNNVAITTTGVEGGPQWKFGTNGSLTVPGGAYIINTDIGGTDYTSLNGPEGGYLVMASKASGGGSRGSVQLNDSGTVRLVAYLDNDHAGAWEFNTDMGLSFPDNTTQYTAFNGSGIDQPARNTANTAQGTAQAAFDAANTSPTGIANSSYSFEMTDIGFINFKYNNNTYLNMSTTGITSYGQMVLESANNVSGNNSAVLFDKDGSGIVFRLEDATPVSLNWGFYQTNVLFPDGTRQYTAFNGSGIDQPARNTANTAQGTATSSFNRANNTLLLVSVPTSSTGQSGDKANSIAANATYLYYCTTDWVQAEGFDPQPDIWKRVLWSNDTW